MIARAIRLTAVALLTGGVVDSVLGDDPPEPLVAVAVAAGAEHTCALMSDGRVFCWGDNSMDQLGRGPDFDEVSDHLAAPVDESGLEPGEYFVTLKAGNTHSAAISNLGYLYVWGDNTSLQLGLGEPYTGGGGECINCTYPSPTPVTLWYDDDAADPNEPGVPFPPEERFVEVSCGGDNTCVITYNDVTEEYQAYCCGPNTTHQCAQQSGPPYCQYLAPPQCLPDLAVGAGLVPIASGGRADGIGHTCAICDDGSAGDGEIWCWGDDSWYQLGRYGSGDPVAVPGPIMYFPASGLFNSYAQVVAGHIHACGLHANGNVYCWGANNLGQLGRGNTWPNPEDWLGWPDPNEPVLLPCSPTHLVAGYGFNLAFGTNAFVYGWGSNAFGQLGHPDYDAYDQQTWFKPTPEPAVTVAGDPYTGEFAAGTAHTAFVTRSGRVYCLGLDTAGQLGFAGASIEAVPTLTVEFPFPPFDYDCDEDVDADDLAGFAACMDGPDNGLPPGSWQVDGDLDSDVDLHDYACMQIVTGT